MIAADRMTGANSRCASPSVADAPRWSRVTGVTSAGGWLERRALWKVLDLIGQPPALGGHVRIERLAP
jgi:hypothetical protein